MSSVGVAASASASASAGSRRFEVSWDPRTGKGEVIQRYDDGALARVCLQCGFPGYTGGLLIGSYSGSGFEYLPPEPLRGFASLNVFCAQDESIWDRASSREYAFGWSENFGTGPDGQRLEYVSGAVRKRGPELVLLTGRNRGGCYQVDKRLLWKREARYLLVSTRIENACDEPVHFDFWTGDDPWLGKYRSSEGDVGYTDQALVRTETKVDPARFRFGGVYDLGNTAAGEQEGSYSGAANFIMLRPDGRKPDRIYFANRFVHADDQIQPQRALDNKTMLALNLGWIDIALRPGGSVAFAYALGLASSTGRAEPPRAPDIAPEDWRALEPRKHPWQELRFDRERIELRLSETELDVVGHYVIANDAQQSRSIGIHYPFPTDAAHPVPDLVELDGRPIEHVNASGARFGIEVPAKGSTKFTVHYRQRHTEKKATYIVTSAERWGRPIRQAEFVIRYPRTMRNVTVSYAADEVRYVGAEVEVRFARKDFAPQRDVVMRWQ